MWSVGCILGEMFVGKAIFPGNSTLNQIERVLELLGKPTKEDVESMESALAKDCLDQINIVKKKSFAQYFPNTSEDALDLLKNLLVLNPNHRLTAEQALNHPYIAEIRDFSDVGQETSCPKIIEISMDDNTKFSIREYREALYNEITKKKRPMTGSTGGAQE